MVTTEYKKRVVEGIKNQEGNFPSHAKMAIALDLNPAQLSRILKGELDNVLSDTKWLSAGRRLNIPINKDQVWKTAKTETFLFIYQQLKECQEKSISGLFCDLPDIGKTHTAKFYAEENKHAVRIDCSQVKSKQKLIRKIAQEFGVTHTGKYADVYEDLVYYLNSVRALVILDEAGDLKYEAFLEIKALWNATEGYCGWFMMGADGLKAKIKSYLGRNTVGYAEIFSRFGSRYQKTSPDGREAMEEFKMTQFAQIVKANAPAADIRKLYASTEGSPRRVKTEIQKLQAA